MQINLLETAFCSTSINMLTSGDASSHHYCSVRAFFLLSWFSVHVVSVTWRMNRNNILKPSNSPSFFSEASFRFCILRRAASGQTTLLGLSIYSGQVSTDVCPEGVCRPVHPMTPSPRALTLCGGFALVVHSAFRYFTLLRPLGKYQKKMDKWRVKRQLKCQWDCISLSFKKVGLTLAS